MQDTGREAYLVGSGVVVGVYCLGRNEPFVFVYGLVSLGKVEVVFKLDSAQCVGKVRLFGVDFKTFVTAPYVGVGYLNVEGCQFFVCFGFCFIAHPLKGVDMLAKGYLQVLYQCHHTFFRLGREVFLYIHFAYGLAHQRVGYGKGVFPSRLLLLFARQCTTVEVELGC